MRDEVAERRVDARAYMRGRTKAYASAIVRLFIKLPRSRTEVAVLGKQLLRSGTSVAANYREAFRARSDAEFVSKIETCAQEVDESMLWLELLKDDCGIDTPSVTDALDESEQLVSIFTSMVLKVKRRLASPSSR